jgi:hypothetical protein
VPLGYGNLRKCRNDVVPRMQHTRHPDNSWQTVRCLRIAPTVEKRGRPELADRPVIIGAGSVQFGRALPRSD